jgi:predicted metal-dependent peptidase
MAKSQALTEALSKCIMQQPFFAVLLMDLMTIQETETAEEGMAIPTAGTDGRMLYINKDWFGELSVDERVFVLSHEVMHVVLEHPSRTKLYMDRGIGPDLKKFSPQKMNVAEDYIINDWIIESGQKAMPHGGLHNPQYDMHWVADELYCKLPDPPQDKGGSDGTGNWDNHMPQGKGKGAPGKADIQTAIKSAASAAKSQGKMPGGMQRLVDEICEPQIDWAEQLKLAVTTSAGKDDNTWARPNRKRLAIAPHVYYPGTCSHRAGVIALASDSSGSVSDKEMAHYWGEMSAIIEELSPEQAWISDCSTQCAEFLPIESADDVVDYKPRTSGGTHMPDIFRQLDEQHIVPECLVILTDGYTDYGKPPGYDVIWVMTTDMTADHGTNLRIKVTGD